MKLVATIAFCSITGLFLQSCGTTAPLKSNRKPYEIDSVAVCHLPSYITSIAKGNRAEYNQVLSDSSLMLRMNAMISIVPQNIVLSDLGFENEMERQTISRSFLDLMNLVESKRKIKGILLTDDLDIFFKRKNIKYVLVTYNSGFTREKGNYGNQIAKGIGVGVLTLGLFTPVPIKANSSLVCFILDIQKGDIAFYQRNTQELEPLKQKNINNQLKNTLGVYYNPTIGH